MLSSISSMPARGDVNPTKTTETYRAYAINSGIGSIVVDGYATLSLNRSSGSGTIKWVNRDGTIGENISPSSTNTWVDIAIPSTAQIALLEGGSNISVSVAYALFTADSPYNPYNQ